MSHLFITDPKLFEEFDTTPSEIGINPPIHHQRIVEDLNNLPGVKVVSTLPGSRYGSTSISNTEEFHLAITEEGIIALQPVFLLWSDEVRKTKPDYSAGSECSLSFRYFDHYLPSHKRATYRGMVLSILHRGDWKVEELHRKMLEEALYKADPRILIRESPEQDWIICNKTNEFTFEFYNLSFVQALLKDKSCTGFFLQGLPHGRYCLLEKNADGVHKTVAEIQTFCRHTRDFIHLTFLDALVANSPVHA